VSRLDSAAATGTLVSEELVPEMTREGVIDDYTGIVHLFAAEFCRLQYNDACKS
jgi:hypothetical protein